MKTCGCWRCENKSEWAWQPFGPGETNTFTAPGSHYRGFPVVAICDLDKRRIEAGWSCHFQYKGTWYEVVSGGEVHTVDYKVVA